MELPIAFENEGQQLIGVLHVPNGASKVPGVVMCHGFTGNRSESHFLFTKAARAFAEAGIAVLRFDFRGSGDSDGSFEDMTVSSEISDAVRAIEVLAQRPEVDANRIGIVGLSLGGCVAACATARSERVRATVLWAPVHDPKVIAYHRNAMEQVFPWEFTGGLLLGEALVRELPTIDPVAELRNARGSVLILHGSADQTLPVEGSEAFVRAIESAGGQVEREIVDGADHTFASVTHERYAIDRTASWFRDVFAAIEPEIAPSAKRISYADAGVDIEAANVTKKRLRELVRESYTPNVLTELGSFGGLFLANFPDLDEPVLVSSTDGVGTKLKVAIAANRHDTVGMDLVNHCVNDILVMGARPIFFQDYIALGKHRGDVVANVVAGLAKACRATGCALLGGETAEMPDMYAPGEYDLAGTIVGIVDRKRILDGSRVRVGDVLIGVGSDGLHTNGYSLARRLIFDEARWSVDHFVPEWGRTVADELLRPHRPYLDAISPLLDDELVHAMAHITGGGITDNVPRVLPKGTAAKVYRDTWDIPPVFNTLYRLGNLDEAEALRTFNMGVGMVLICDSDDSETVMGRLRSSGERVWQIGEVVDGKDADGEVRYA